MKKKKFFSFLLVISIIVSMFAGTISAEAATSGDYEYTVNEDGTTCAITQYNGTDADVTIPGKLDVYTVTSIDYYAFNGCITLKSVRIPSSVTTIGYGVFVGCSALTAINVDAGNGNFSSLDGVLYNKAQTTLVRFPGGLTSVTIPSSVTTIGDNTFCNCSNLTDVTIPNSVTTIEPCAFYGCSKLTSVTIPSSVTSIDRYAFAFTGLTSITIPDSVTAIGEYAFFWCTDLANVTIEKGVKVIGNHMFRSCTSLTGITIPSSVTSIGIGAFAESGLTGITIENGVTSTGDFAFFKCNNLTNITIPNSVTTIGEYAFDSCNNLTNITIPNSVTTIGEYAFDSCNKLTDITIPNSVTTIGEYAFAKSGLTSVYFDGDMPSIGTKAFYDCPSSLKCYYQSGKTGFSYGSIEFDDQEVKTIAVDLLIKHGSVTPSTIFGIPGETISFKITPDVGCILKSLKYKIGSDDIIITGTSITMPNDAITVCAEFEEKFLDVSTFKLAISPSHPGSFTVSLGADTTAATSATITSDNTDAATVDKATVSTSGETVTVNAVATGTANITVSFNDSAKTVKTIVVTVEATPPTWSLLAPSETGAEITASNVELGFSETVTEVDNKKVTISDGTNTYTYTIAAGDGYVSGTGSSCKTTIPVSKFLNGTAAIALSNDTTYTVGVEAGAYIDGMGNEIASSGAGSFKTCGIYSYDINTNGTTCTISGYTGSGGDITIPASLDGYTVTAIGNEVFQYNTSLTKVTIPDSVTSIGDYAFAESGLTSVTIPDSVTSIGDYAFAESGLTSVTIPDSVTTIGDYAFFAVSGLTSVTIPDSVTTIGYGAFAVSGLASVTIPDSVTTIGDYAFAVSGLASVTIENGVTSIGNSMFYGCSLLTSVTIPDSVTSIGYGAFAESGLASVTIPDSVTTIGDYAFAGSGLTSVTIENGVTSIGECAFLSCTDLIRVYFDGIMPTIGSDAFYDCPTSLFFYCPLGNPGSITLTPLAELETNTIKVSSTTNGTIVPSTLSGMSGETISLQITPDAGYSLKPGSLKYNDGSNDITITGTSITMPNNAIKISAVFEDSTPTVLSVTPTGTGAPISGSIAVTFSEAMNTAAGLVSLDGGSTILSGGTWSGGNSVYTVSHSALLYGTTYTVTVSEFKDTSNNVMTADSTHGFTTAAEPETTGSGGNSGGGSSSSSGSNITVTTNNYTTTATQTITATTGSGGVAAVSVTSMQISDMIAAADKKATDANVQTAVNISVKTGSGATGVSVTIPQAAASALSDNASALTISSSVSTVTLDSTALAEIGKQTTGDITITAMAADTDGLSDESKTAIGSRPVYDLKITSGNITISSFGGGTATVSVPYTPTSREDTSKIVVYYISRNGELIMVPGCVYDASTGTVNFTTTHFSTYAIGYNDVSFTDVSGWYTDYVSYLAARQIINGTGDGKFSPDANITRAEFVTILAKLSGDDLSGYTSSFFSDVATTNWYFAAVQWAYKNGIASGYDGKFSPDSNITREQMAVMLYNYAKYVGDVSNVEGMSVREFKDYDSISSWALKSIQWAMNNSIISSNTGGSFTPAANATRAQAAKMIAVFMQGMIK